MNTLSLGVLYCFLICIASCLKLEYLNKNVKNIKIKMFLKLHVFPLHRKKKSYFSSLKMMFDNYSEKSIKAIMLAQEESRRSAHHCVGCEELFLGILAQTNGLGYKALTNLNITLSDARETLSTYIEKTGFTSPEIPFTQSAKRALERAHIESRQLGQVYIDTEHVLLGILREEDGNISRYLSRKHLNKEKVKDEILKCINSVYENEDSNTNSKHIASTVGGVEHSKVTMTLKEYSLDLTEKAKRGHLDPVVGRQSEINRVIQILLRRNKSNPVLIGEPGVGKTAIAEGVAQRISISDIPSGKTKNAYIYIYI